MSSMPCATYKKLKTLPFRSWNQQWNYVAKLIRHKKSIFLTDLRHIVHQEVTIRLFLLLIILLKIQLSQHQLQKKVILCGSSGLILCKFNKQCFDQLSLRKKKNILTGSVFRRHYIEKKNKDTCSMLIIPVQNRVELSHHKNHIFSICSWWSTWM